MSLCAALLTFVSLDLDVAQDYLPLLAQQLRRENEATRGRILLSCYVYQGTMHDKTAGAGVKNWNIVTLQETENIYLIVKY